MNDINDNSNYTVVKFELPQVVNDALKPLATAIGDTLSTGWKGLTLGIDTWYNKKKIHHDLNLAAYRQSIQAELSSIPEEHLQEPKMSILGPSLDASKYYFEEEWYRDMFSKLIAGTCDDRKSKKIHPYFVEAIKQMTTQDAIVLSMFKEKNNYPIATYRYKVKNGTGEEDLFNFVFYTGADDETPTTNAASIANLARLRFIEYNMSRHYVNEHFYTRFINDPYFVNEKETISANKDNPNYKAKELVLVKGIVKLTPLGQDFIDICI